jgi:O-antigen chain-terminating methyltransferase
MSSVTPAPQEAFRAQVERAASVSDIGTRMPSMSTLRGLRRRLATPIARLLLRAADLVTREQRTFNHAAVASLRALEECMRAVDERLSETRAELAARFESVGRELADAGAKAAERTRALEAAIWPALEGQQRTMGEMDERQAALSARVGDALTQIRDERTRIEQVRAELVLQERRLAQLLEVTRRDGTLSPAVAREAEGHLLDHFYSTFENRFRGSCEDVKRRVHAYLDTVRAANAGTAARPVVDVGCGRGEWLDLLAEHGLCARGADLNDVTVSDCRARGLDVAEADALSFLCSLPDASAGAVTALHVLEHLAFRTMVSLIEESVRVLAPGGVAIFETPNPENLLVGACRFYIDPTHRHPLHPDMLAFVAQARGLQRVEIRRLHPVEESEHFPADGSPVTTRLNELLFGPQDFAVVGYRA